MLISEEDPPEYNVAARLRQLNEELAQEADPDDERERSIKFKEDLVDLVAPPPDYPSEEEGEGATDRTEDSYRTQSPESPRKYNDEDFEDSAESPKQSEHYEESNNNDDKSVKNKQSSQATADSKKSQNVTRSNGSAAAAGKKRTGVLSKDGSASNTEEKILVERDGKFELIHSEDLTAEERQMYLPQSAGEEDEVGLGGSSESYEPTPPRNPRPATAGNTSSRRRVTSAPPRRAQSAQAKRVENKPILEDFHYTSPYAITDQQKKTGREQKKAMAERQKKEQQLKKMEEEEKNRENNEAFQAWLAHKRRDLANRRKEDNEKQKEQKKTESERKKVNVVEYLIWFDYTCSCRSN